MPFYFSQHFITFRVQRLSTCASVRHSTARIVTLANHHRKPAISTYASQRSPYHSTPPLTLLPKPLAKFYQPIRPLLHKRAMSDDAYSSFLDKANQDTSASKASTQSKSVSTKAVDTEVPATLQSVEQYYTSEADEPFEPVSLEWGGRNMPSESMCPTAPDSSTSRSTSLQQSLIAWRYR